MYVHGYHSRENERLQDQAGTLVDLLHSDAAYPAGSTVLEIGCGVGAQTVPLAQRSPAARFTSIDLSADSIAEAKRKVVQAGLTNVEFRQADIFALPFSAESFDHLFVCFVLEHLARPVEALVILRHLLKPGGTITVIEGDHGSTYFYPATALSLAGQSRFRSCTGLAQDGVRRFKPTRPCRWFHEKDLHGHDRRNPAVRAGGRFHRSQRFRYRCWRSSPDIGGGWRVLLHVLQGRR